MVSGSNVPKADMKFLLGDNQNERQKHNGPDERAAVLGEYVTRWMRWAGAGLGDLSCDLTLPALAEP